jgi:uncharacterized protein (DUF697 family)
VGVTTSTLTPRQILDGALDEASADEKAKARSDLIQTTSMVTAALALQPVPLLDTIIFTQRQRRLVQSLARLHGYRIDNGELRDFFSVLRGRLVGPNVAVAVAKFVQFIPYAPEIFAGAVAYALTAAVGELGDRYFASGRAMSPDVMRTCFDKAFKDAFSYAFKEGRDEMKAMFRSPEVRREIHGLKEERRAGRMPLEEMVQKTEEILGHHHPHP